MSSGEAQRDGHGLDAEFFARLFESAGLAIFACDDAGRAYRRNPEAEQLFAEFEIGGAAEPDVRLLLPEADRAAFDEQLKSVLESGAPGEFRATIERRNRGPVEYAVWLTPMRKADGSGVTIWLHDLTARLQVRRSSRKRERLTMLGVMSGAVAHHYNNFLCGIATTLEIARTMTTASAMRRALDRTSEAIQRATQLTQQLLAFAQADYRLRDEADLTEVLLQFLDEVEPRLNSLAITVDLTWRMVPIRAVRREHLRIVLQNLVSNAEEAMPTGGTVSVTLEPSERAGIRLEVRDSGAGIPEANMERLFEPFFTTKADLTARRPRPAAGMGLAVVYGLVGEMQGSISATNAPTGGAAFEILFSDPEAD